MLPSPPNPAPPGCGLLQWITGWPEMMEMKVPFRSSTRIYCDAPQSCSGGHLAPGSSGCRGESRRAFRPGDATRYWAACISSPTASAQKQWRSCGACTSQKCLSWCYTEPAGWWTSPPSTNCRRPDSWSLVTPHARLAERRPRLLATPVPWAAICRSAALREFPAWPKRVPAQRRARPRFGTGPEYVEPQ